MARASLVAFFGLIILNNGSSVVWNSIGLDPGNAFGGTLLFPAIISLFLSTGLYVISLPWPVVSLSRFSYWRKIVLLAATVTVLSVYGLYLGNLHKNILIELWTYSVVICFMVLGQYDKVWLDLEKPLICFFWLAFFMVIVGLSFTRQNLIENGLDSDSFIGARPTYTAGYAISNLLDMWPIVFSVGLVRTRRDAWKFAGVIVIFAYFAVEIYFQKRAPSIRTISYFIMALIVFRTAHRANFTKPLVAGLFGILVVIAIMPMGDLQKRFLEKDSSRMEEAGRIVESLNGFEILVGRGMGGYYLDDFRGQVQIINEAGQFGRTIMHIGALYPVLKGGVLFLFIHVSFIWPFLMRFRSRHWLENKYNMVSLIVLPVYVLFRFVEGPFSSGAAFDAVLFGLCVARAPIAFHMKSRPVSQFV